jgi:hypothetical protein
LVFETTGFTSETKLLALKTKSVNISTKLYEFENKNETILTNWLGIEKQNV